MNQNTTRYIFSLFFKFLLGEFLECTMLCVFCLNFWLNNKHHKQRWEIIFIASYWILRKSFNFHIKIDMLAICFLWNSKSQNEYFSMHQFKSKKLINVKFICIFIKMPTGLYFLIVIVLLSMIFNLFKFSSEISFIHCLYVLINGA